MKRFSCSFCSLAMPGPGDESGRVHGPHTLGYDVHGLHSLLAKHLLEERLELGLVPLLLVVASSNKKKKTESFKKKIT
jgi:hypothetical protein